MPGLVEILIIAVLAFLFFGYRRIPFIGKSLGVGIGEFGRSFRKAADLPDILGEPEKEEKRHKSRRNTCSDS